jgi:aspartate/methionine/tyrosine aminotransferase
MLAAIALRSRDHILARNRSIASDNLSLLLGFFRENDDLFDGYVPEGSCVVFPRYLGAEGAEEFCRAAVEEDGVLLLPPGVYRSRLGPVSEERMRIGFGRRDFAEGLEVLRNRVLRNRGARRGERVRA